MYVLLIMHFPECITEREGSRMDFNGYGRLEKHNPLCNTWVPSLWHSSLPFSSSRWVGWSIGRWMSKYVGSNVGLVYKVVLPNSNRTLIWTPLFEWYVVRCGSKNGHQKNPTILGSIINMINGDQYDHLMSTIKRT